MKKGQPTYERSLAKQASPEGILIQRRKQLKHLYNMSLDDYLTLFEAQDGVCRICKEPSIKNLCVDHDHNCCPGRRSCGRCVRGLLCQRCNATLGRIHEDTNVLRAMIRYLED